MHIQLALNGTGPRGVAFFLAGYCFRYSTLVWAVILENIIFLLKLKRKRIVRHREPAKMGSLLVWDY